MGLETDIAILSRIGLFRDLNRDQLRLLAFGAEHLKLPANISLFEPDDPADCAYVVISGEIELFRSRGSERIEIGRVGKGSLLGELALITPGQRQTGAAARVDTELMRLDQKLFHRLLEEYPETALRLHRIITANLKNFLDRISELGNVFKD